MRVYINVDEALATVTSIRSMAHQIVQRCDSMYDTVAYINGDIQTSMGDAVYKKVTKINDQISRLKKEMMALEAYANRLAEYIASYTKCSYDGSSDPGYANVDTGDLDRYANNVNELSSNIESFCYAAEQTVSDNLSQIGSGMDRLENRIGDAATTLRYLKDKIDRAKAKVEQLKGELSQLGARLSALTEQIAQHRALARQAHAEADAVHVPEPRSRTVTDSQGNTRTVDNYAEVAAAKATKARFEAEAAKHDQAVTRLEREAETVKRQIESVSRELERVQGLLTQMVCTRQELEAHIREMKSSREKLGEARDAVRWARTRYEENSSDMKKKATTAKDLLGNAQRALDGYSQERLGTANLQSIFDILFGEWV